MFNKTFNINMAAVMINEMSKKIFSPLRSLTTTFDSTQGQQKLISTNSNFETITK